jgi:hypothetical protein
VDHSIDFVDEEAAQRNVPPDVTLHTVELVDGAVLLEGRTTDPIERVKGALNFIFHLGLEVSGDFVGMQELLSGLVSHVNQVVAHVANSTAAAQVAARPPDWPKGG